MGLSISLFAVGLLHAAASASATTMSQDPARVQVLVLGVYHMANPGQDVFNMQADDVLTPKRQAEMTEVMTVLKRFKPTRIAVERDFNDQRVAKAYAEYLAGKHELTRNEVEQIGFRLGKELLHQKVYGVDADGDFPWQHLVNWAKANGRSDQLNAMMSDIGNTVKAQGEYLASHTILEMLLYLNADEKVAADVGFYFRQAEYGEPWDQAGADLVAAWFQRNVRIYSNVARLVESPGERVLVIFGAGHLGWLQHAFASNPRFRVVKLSEFTR